MRKGGCCLSFPINYAFSAPKESKRLEKVRVDVRLLHFCNTHVTPWNQKYVVAALQFMTSFKICFKMLMCEGTGSKLPY